MSIVHDIVTAAISSILLEVSATPKPGNVHRYHDFPDTKYEHFVVSAASMHKPLIDLASKTYHKVAKGEISRLDVGKFIFECVSYAKKWYVGGNTNLGTSTIFSIEVPALICTKLLSKTYDPKKVSLWAIQIAEKTTIEDAIFFYKAIRVANPSYLGRVVEAQIPDVFDPLFEKKLKENRKTLWDVWKHSSTWDIVSENCISGLKTVIEGFYAIDKYLSILRNWNLAIISAYLELLSKYGDSLVLRKHGGKVQEEISEEAEEVLNALISDVKKGLVLLKQFDEKLYRRKINPGSIADIIAGSIMLALLNDLRP
ncbi:MAG: hypothetical protein DRO23_12480 [Thermoprotei archaeon]|nr:MAG: hypothetical protein DRO23_12480 [Thermoprotei archaeon]